MMQLALPPRAQERRVLPFTEKVIGMPADSGKALVYDRRTETIQRISGLCCSAIRAAKRRDAAKMFEMRPVSVRGQETYAVWRIK